MPAAAEAPEAAWGFSLDTRSLAWLLPACLVAGALLGFLLGQPDGAAESGLPLQLKLDTRLSRAE